MSLYYIKVTFSATAMVTELEISLNPTSKLDAANDPVHEIFKDW